MAGITNYDGSIKIDTRIDDKSFNTGVKRVTAVAGGVMAGILAKFGSGVKRVLTQFHSVIREITGLMVVALGLLALKIYQTLSDSISKTSVYYDTIQKLNDAFAELKGAFLSAFASLLTAALPYILIVINWLIRMLNLISMIIAAWSGQKSVIQYDAAATATLAKNTEKTKKAAQGALAAFDQINVLQKPETGTTTPPGGNGGTLVFKVVPVEPEILATVNRIKGWFIDTWTKIKQGASDAWKWVTTTWGNISQWFQDRWASVRQWASDAWQNIGKWASDTKQKIVDAWNDFTTWFKTTVIDPLWQIVGPVWNWISIVAHDAWVTITYLWGLAKTWFLEHVVNPLRAIFEAAWIVVSAGARLAWGKITEIWTAVKDWFKEHVTQPLQDAFGTALEWVRSKWESIFSGIRDFVKGIINGIIGFINTLISGFMSGFNGIIGTLNGIGSNIPGWIPIPPITAPQIPYLATGAVIPPNSQFLAVLGDQKRGTNIEAPEGLLRQIFSEELRKAGLDNMTVNLTATLDGEKIYQNQLRVQRRHGLTVTKSGAGI